MPLSCLEKEWTKNYWNFIKNNKDENWNWYILCKNINLHCVPQILEKSLVILSNAFKGP